MCLNENFLHMSASDNQSFHVSAAEVHDVLGGHEVSAHYINCPAIY
jgi:hypothetical protein